MLATRLSLFVCLLAAIVDNVSAARMLKQDNSTALTGRALQTFSFTGDGTAFSDAVGDGSGFACSFRYLAPLAQKNFVAINSEQWEAGAQCGKCVKVACVDAKCPTQNKPITAMIVDKCPECKTGDLDFSYPAYKEVTGTFPNRLKVSWEFTDCGDLVEGSIKVAPKDSNPYYSAWYFSNSKYPIKSISINGVTLTKQEFNFWVLSAALPSAPYKIELVADNGKTVLAEIGSLGEKNVDLNIQFD